MPDETRIEALLSQWEDFVARDQTITPEELCRDSPELLDTLRERIAAVQAMNAMLDTQALGGSLTPATLNPRMALPGYEILGELGRGGMGVVYKARHQGLNRVVALKMVLHAEHAGEQDLARFLAEAEAVAHLQHPNIVQVFESGRHNGLPYFTLEFVPGGNLADRLREQPLPPKEAARLVQQVAGGIQHAHEQGIVHRDLKPANVLLAPASGGREPPEGILASGGSCPPLAECTAKVTDFGLARRVQTGSGLTATGAVLGTPSYMAPEQAAGKTKEAGPLADVYALGAILYECLTGRPPFRAATALETMLQVIGEEPVPPGRLNAQVPRDLETVCLKCLQKEPSKRYPSAAALAEDLGRFLADEPIKARPAGTAERVWKWAKRRPALAGLTAISVLGGLLLIGVIAAAAAVVYRNNLELEKANTDLQQQRDLAQAAEEKTRKALVEVENTLLDGLVRPIGSTWGEMTPDEMKALAEVAQFPDVRLRLRFLERGLERPETAERLGRRSKEVVQAIAGTDPGRQEQVRELVVAKVHDRTEDFQVRASCAQFGMATEAVGLEFDREAARLLLEQMGRTTDVQGASSLSRNLAILVGRMKAAAARASAEFALEQMGRTTDATALFFLSEAVAGLAGRLDAAEGAKLSARAAPKVLEQMARTTEAYSLSSLGRAIASLAGRMDAAEGARLSARAAPRLREQMGRVTNDVELSQLADAIAVLAGRMDAAEGARLSAQVVPMVLDRMARTTDPTNLFFLTDAVAALAARMDAEGARVTAPKVLEHLAHTTDRFPLFSLSRAVAALAARMDAEQAGMTAPKVLDQIARTTDDLALAQLGQAVAALAGRMDAPEGVRLSAQAAPKLLERLDRIKEVSALASLGQTIATLAEHLEPAEAERSTAAAIRRILREMDGPSRQLLVDPFTRLAEHANRRQLVGILTAKPLPSPATQAVLQALTPLTCSYFKDLDEAVAFLRDTAGP